ncbi:MAG TPA: GAF domain-containing protein [Candidatus Sulfotelmatobacter sp.]|nr:GAF domain-containing protein [Candidatus Sulfotelmatobacter sp.]
MQPESTNRSTPAHLAAALMTDVRFPGEDDGQSLGAMAQRDLDAALQLLADRAQYITGSSGAAIALRRGGRNDMLCRASSGANAPELGALLSTEFGLSGESVRTRQLLRCDDAERDARVNQEACRALGIASVAVMPVVNDDEVLGVFELFSGRSHAFGERDFAALRRLSEMVETAVKLARAAEGLERLNTDLPYHASSPVETLKDSEPVLEVETEEVETEIVGLAQPAAEEVHSGTAPAVFPAVAVAVPPVAESAGPALAVPEQAAPAEPAPMPQAAASNPLTKPLLWSITLDARGESDSADDQNGVPAAFRNLRKCEACGFPVSTGRTYCVECEEKKWRGQLKPKPKQPNSPAPSATSPTLTVPKQSTMSAGTAAAAAPARSPEVRPEAVAPAPVREVPSSVAPRTPVEAQPVRSAAPLPQPGSAMPPANVTASPAPELILTAAMGPTESWFSSHKFIVIPILLIAAIVGAFLLIR